MASMISTMSLMPPTSIPINKRVKRLLACLPPLVVPRSSVVLREFTIFSKLPQHLRLYIWSLVASESRYIKLIGLERHIPASYQIWNSRVLGQPKNPGMLHACRESRIMASRYYKRCYEKAQQQPENKAIKWTGTSQELQEAKRNDQSQDGTAIFVNFASDIFIHSQCPATAQDRGLRSADIRDYNFKPIQLRFCQTVQQVYSEEKGMAFPLQLLCFANIKEYGIELDGDSKEVISRLTPIGRDVHLALVSYNIIRALYYALGRDLTKLLLGKANVVLR
ncbi:hypothetical protein VTL71DRAFT_6321 [Oculimacula yallundae]|uniref:2EXR domain-containing protein n=1 Tax=Oculimacula yallundae TaxID=86028 RepID=A0ABR4BWM3_9HELO